MSAHPVVHPVIRPFVDADLAPAAALVEGELAGFIGLRERSHVFHLFVDERWQRRGFVRTAPMQVAAVLYNPMRLDPGPGADPGADSVLVAPA